MRRLCSMLLPLWLLVALAGAESVPVYARNGMVSSVEPYATEVGVQILKGGGNAYDAAVAVGFALAVTHPQAGNIGGGGFCVALSADGRSYALDFRETAPLAATRDMFLDESGNVAAGRSLTTHLGVGVPGTVDGLLKLHEKFGKLSRRQVLEPSIRLARNGFVVSKSLSDSFRSAQPRIGGFKGTATAFYSSGSAPVFGDRLVQRDLAASLERIAARGRAGFYEGETAKLLLSEMRRNGGIITQTDLERYSAKWREPFTMSSGGDVLIMHPLPSSGGITIAQILRLVDREELRRAGRNSAQYIHMLTEAERLAYADRNTFLGDTDFVKVPIERLISSSYLAERRKLLPKGKAGRSEGVGPGKPEPFETTHYCTADVEGNVVAITYTLNSSFGMGAVVEGAGFLLNNEMDDFTSKPGVPNLYGLVQSDANAIQPGKRMLSSMTPTIVTRGGKFFATFGSPGGSTIITTVLQTYLNVSLFGMNIRDAIDAPRFHHQWLPDEVVVETDSFSPDTVSLLATMGYKLRQTGALGTVAGIQRLPSGIFAGWSDRRTDGSASGY